MPTIRISAPPLRTGAATALLVATLGFLSVLSTGCVDEVCTTDADCPAGRDCTDGACVPAEGFNIQESCPEGESRCDGDCVDTDTSPRHCGECGNVCSDLEICLDGVCENNTSNDCADGQTPCDDECVDTDTDPDHCGGCNQACPADNRVCTDGTCGLPPCPDGQRRCESECVDPQTNSDHCGGCNQPCGDAESCFDGRCLGECDPDGEPFGGGQGTEAEPYLICSDKHFHAIDTAGAMDAHFAQRADLSFQPLSSGPIGSPDPMADVITPFTGTYDGNGQTIDNLGIPADGAGTVGMFARLGPEGRISDLELTNIDVTGENIVGGVAGINEGLIEEVTVDGSVSGHDQVGGLVGQNTGTVVDAKLDVEVSGNDWVGGLVGHFPAPGSEPPKAIENSSTTGSVEGNNWIGGVVGFNEADLATSNATGSIEGKREVGGLIGRNKGDVTDSHAEGDVEASDQQAGGLIGQNRGAVDTSYATGTVEASTRRAGGLIGEHRGTLERSFATGDVEAPEATSVGGAVARLSLGGEVADTHATGDVVGGDFVGGFIGANASVGFNPDVPAIRTSHATGSVEGDDNVGGFVGNNQGVVETSYYNTATTGMTTSDGGTGLAGDVYGDPDRFEDFDFENVWTIETMAGTQQPVLQWWAD